MQLISNNVQDCDYSCSLKFGFRIIVLWGLWSLILLCLAIFFNGRSTSDYQSVLKSDKATRRAKCEAC